MAEIDILTLCLIFATLIKGHFGCTPEQLVISNASLPASYYKQLNVSWHCFDQAILQESQYEYQVAYQLTNYDQCYEDDGSSIYNLKTTTWSIIPSMDLGDGHFEFSTTLDDLYPYSTYRVTVYSRPDFSAAPIASDDRVVTTSETVPAAFVDQARKTLINKNQLSFSWDDLSCRMRQGVITGYVYRLQSDHFNSGYKLLDADASRTAIFGGLSPDTTYLFSIAPINAAGKGTFTRYDANTNVTEVSVLDMCKRFPCPNEARCYDQRAYTYCICSDGDTGSNCEDDFNLCASLPCMHAGGCIEVNNSYTCNCEDGYYGNICELSGVPITTTTQSISTCPTITCSNSCGSSTRRLVSGCETCQCLDPPAVITTTPALGVKNTSGGGLPVAAIAGGCGAAVLIVVIVIIAILLYMRHQKSSAQNG